MRWQLSSPVAAMRNCDVRAPGGSIDYVGGSTQFVTNYSPMGATSTQYETSYWELHSEMQDSSGDGTVPTSSGRMPGIRGAGNIKQQFRLTGFGHEKSYQNALAQSATLLSITKIAGQAKRPA